LARFLSLGVFLGISIVDDTHTRYQLH